MLILYWERYLGLNLGFSRQIVLSFVLNNNFIVDFIQCIVNIVTPSPTPPLSTFSTLPSLLAQL